MNAKVLAVAQVDRGNITQGRDEQTAVGTDDGILQDDVGDEAGFAPVDKAERLWILFIHGPQHDQRAVDTAYGACDIFLERAREIGGFLPGALQVVVVGDVEMKGEGAPDQRDHRQTEQRGTLQ